MPRIIVTTDDPSGRVMHSERVTREDFQTEHFRTQLAERVAWAVEDADRDLASDAADPLRREADSEAATPVPAHAV